LATASAIRMIANGTKITMRMKRLNMMFSVGSWPVRKAVWR
jgi:hypothetical protein